jgi:hypothetical protein
MKTRLFSLMTVIVLLLCSVSSVGAITWTPLDLPRPLEITDISGSNIVTAGGVYNLDSQVWTTIDYPGASSTSILGIEGSDLVGYYISDSGQHGFFYDGTTWTTRDFPGASSTSIYGIDGSSIVGSYEISGCNYHGFLYDGTTWTTLDFPGASRTEIRSIDGSNIVGWYESISGRYGFVYDGTTWTSLNFPGANNEAIWGIDGRNIVGSAGGHGVIYNLDSQNWATLDFPEVSSTYIRGIDGDNIVGLYEDASGYYHGFIATIPEPASVFLVIVGAGLLRLHNRKR